MEEFVNIGLRLEKWDWKKFQVAGFAPYERRAQELLRWDGWWFVMFDMLDL